MGFALRGQAAVVAGFVRVVVLPAAVRVLSARTANRRDGLLSPLPANTKTRWQNAFYGGRHGRSAAARVGPDGGGAVERVAAVADGDLHLLGHQRPSRRWRRRQAPPRSDFGRSLTGNRGQTRAAARPSPAPTLAASGRPPGRPSRTLRAKRRPPGTFTCHTSACVCVAATQCGNTYSSLRAST